MKTQIYILTLLILTFNNLKAQKYYIPDPAFRACLVTDFPTAFDTNDSLIISNANSVTGTIYCSERGIQNIEGLQYFTSIKEIFLDSNDISVFPSLVGFNNLLNITLQDNQLESIPDLRSIPNLQKVILHGNNITELPDFNGLSKLNFFSAISNPVEKMPDFTGTSLDFLFFNNTKITELHPSVLTNQPNLKVIGIRHCFFDTLPDLSNLALTSLRTEFNYLTYDDLLSFVGTPNEAAVTLDQGGMRDFTLNYNGAKVENKRFRLTFPYDDTVSTNVYSWYLNDELFRQTKKNRLVIAKVRPEHSGNWRCEVTNTSPMFDGKNFKLTTLNKRVTITGCFAESELVYQVDNVDCKNGDRISLNQGFLQNYTAPLSVELTENVRGDTINADGLTLENVQAGSYSVKITDNNGCEFIPATNLIVNKDESCDEVFTPNGDGQNDVFYFELTGKVSVYNVNNQLVREISNENFWDGKDNQAKIVHSGYYALIDETEKVVYVTVLR